MERRVAFFVMDVSNASPSKLNQRSEDFEMTLCGSNVKRCVAIIRVALYSRTRGDQQPHDCWKTAAGRQVERGIVKYGGRLKRLDEGLVAALKDGVDVDF